MWSSIMKIRNILIFKLFILLTVPSITTASDMTEFLNDYEKIVVSYEKYADKPKLCANDILMLNTEILPVLLPLSQKAQTVQDQFTADDLLRYLEVVGRFSQAMNKLSPKMSNVSC
jgi:hypothetical protein